MFLGGLSEESNKLLMAVVVTAIVVLLLVWVVSIVDNRSNNMGLYYTFVPTGKQTMAPTSVVGQTLADHPGAESSINPEFSAKWLNCTTSRTYQASSALDAPAAPKQPMQSGTQPRRSQNTLNDADLRDQLGK